MSYELSGTLRKLARWLVARFLLMTGGLHRARRALIKENGILVLTLHRVLTHDERGRACSEPGIVVSRQNFEALMDHLAEHYEVIRIADLASRAWPKPSSKPRIAVTFDDGWQDNFEPLLNEARRRSTPMTIFVCSDLAGAHSPFWPERVQALLNGKGQAEVSATIERLKNLTKAERSAAIEHLVAQHGAVNPSNTIADATLPWNALRELSRAGIDIESHAQTHEILTTLRDAEAAAELAESRRVISKELARDCRVVAYPNGNHSPAIRQSARQAGYELGCAVTSGFWTPASDRLAIPRVNICDSKLTEFGDRFQATSFEYAVVWRAWQAHRQQMNNAIQVVTARVAPGAKAGVARE